MIGAIYSKELLPKVLDQTKTVTRRLMKPQPVIEYGYPRWKPKKGYDINLIDHSDIAVKYAPWPLHSVQYIREPFRYVQADGNLNDFWIEFKDGTCIGYRDNGGIMDYPIDEKWLSPYWMKASQARWFQQIIDVRPERLQEITWEDTHKEGILRFDSDNPDPTNGGVGYNRGATGLPMRYESITAFSDLWDSTAKEGFKWVNNPFVWVYTFKLLHR